MNKQELIDAIAASTGETKRSVTAILEALSEQTTAALQSGEEVTLHGLGKLKPVDKAARTGRNPQTGEPVAIEARTNVKFTAAKALKDALN